MCATIAVRSAIAGVSIKCYNAVLIYCNNVFYPRDAMLARLIAIVTL